MKILHYMSVIFTIGLCLFIIGKAFGQTTTNTISCDYWNGQNWLRILNVPFCPSSAQGYIFPTITGITGITTTGTSVAIPKDWVFRDEALNIRNANLSRDECQSMVMKSMSGYNPNTFRCTVNDLIVKCEVVQKFTCEMER